MKRSEGAARSGGTGTQGGAALGGRQRHSRAGRLRGAAGTVRATTGPGAAPRPVPAAGAAPARTRDSAGCSAWPVSAGRAGLERPGPQLLLRGTGRAAGGGASVLGAGSPGAPAWRCGGLVPVGAAALREAVAIAQAAKQ